MEPQLAIKGNWKIFRSPNYNYNFNMVTGQFSRWGATEADDPAWSEFGPEIADIEISDICHGLPDKAGNFVPCPFCYKSNTACGTNMTLETFKGIVDKFPKYNGIHFTTQIAFGLGSIDGNPDLFPIMAYCREIGIIPNLTINGARLTDEIVSNLVQYAGAISVSRYEDRDICYDAIKRLTDAGLKQCNIHQLLATESYNQCMEVMDDYLTDVRLKSLNAIVFLALKQKGRGVHFNKLPHDSYKEIVKFALDNKIPFGSDSCNCNNLERVMIELGKDGIYNQSFEPCESVSFSIYLDVDGVTYPCSFATESAEGIDVKAVTHFLDEVWFNDITCTERKRISDNCRSCPYFDV